MLYSRSLLTTYFMCVCVCVCVKVAQSFLTLWDPMDYSPSSCTIHRILQARILEWVAFSRDLPDPGIKPGSATLQADFLPFEPPGKLSLSLCLSVSLSLCVSLSLSLSIYKHMKQCENPKLLIYPSLILIAVSLFSVSVRLFLFCKQVQLYHFLRFYI